MRSKIYKRKLSKSIFLGLSCFQFLRSLFVNIDLVCYFQLDYFLSVFVITFTKGVLRYAIQNYKEICILNFITVEH